jgi:putative ABC transport system substrate-binding protein
MRRRDFIKAIAGSAAAWPLAARAQQPERMRRVGWLVGLRENDQEAQRRTGAFVHELQRLGWSVGRNIQIDYRWFSDGVNQTQTYAHDLIGSRPDVVVASSTPAIQALLQQSSSIPIVFAIVTDPVASGLVKSLATPGGNITGFTNFEFALGGKWLELLRQASPQIAKVALIYNPKTTPYLGYLQSIEASAQSFDVEVTARGVADADEIERTIRTTAAQLSSGLIIFPDLFTSANNQLIISLAAQQKVPAMYPYRYMAVAGGLMSYGVNTAEEFRRAASYVDRILKGAKPADLPVQAPNKYELVINLRAAKALDLTIPPTLLARADEVIE